MLLLSGATHGTNDLAYLVTPGVFHRRIVLYLTNAFAPSLMNPLLTSRAGGS